MAIRPLRICTLILLSVVVSLTACEDNPLPAGDDDVAPPGDIGGDAVDAVDDDVAEVRDEPRPDAAEDPAEDAEIAEDGSGDTADERCPEDQCVIDSKCVENGSSNPDNPCEACLVVVSRTDWSPDDTGSCDDGDACTSDDACFDGACVGTIRRCDDRNVCTADSCDPDTGECVSVAVDGGCSDGDPCTVGDTCSEGACVPGTEALACDDGNDCTVDVCAAGLGCRFEPAAGASCDDGDSCTIGDACGDDGRCLPGEERVVCDDGSLCTLDWCDPELGCQTRSIADLCQDGNPCARGSCDPARGCVYEPIDAAVCDDGNVCTTRDRCWGGVCRGVLRQLDDMNPCTDDECVHPIGITHTPNTLPCSDNNACTVGDVCGGGTCHPGTTPRNCEDDNPCTSTWCDPATGCRSAPLSGACDDNSVCTQADLCIDGTCTGRPISCDDGNACTIDECDPVAGCRNRLILSNSCRPVITITYPPRGATILDDGSGIVQVTGNVQSGAGPISALFINDQNVLFDGVTGNFSYPLDASEGGNFLVVEATDVLGTPRKVVQSFLFSDSYALPNATGTAGHVTQGLGIYLGDPALAVIGRIVALVLANYDLNGLLPDPVLSEAGHTVRPRGPNPVTFGTPSALLDARPGFLRLSAAIPDLRARLRISGWACSGDVDYTAASLNVIADMRFTVVANQLVGTLSAVDATIVAGRLNISCFLGSLIELIVGDLSGDFESAIEDALRDEIGPLLGEAFSAFALSFPLELPSIDPSGPPIVVQLNTDFQSVHIDDDGMNMVERTIAIAEHRVPYTNRGVSLRSGCGPTPQEVRFYEQDPLELVLADDTISLLLHGAWRAGLLEFDVPPEMLGDIDLTTYGITDLSLRASGMLAPTVSDCQGGTSARVHIGDLIIDASMNLLGTPLDVRLYISLSTLLELTASAGEIGIAISGIDRVELQVEVADEDFIAVESTFESLIMDNLVPSLLGVLGGDALGAFPLPSIDLSDAIDGAPPGTAINIIPSRVRRNFGNSVVGGILSLD